MIKVLFICHGNICRSPMAEFVLKDMVKKAGLSDRVEVASAATSTEEIGNPVYPPAKRTLNAHAIGCEGHHARQMTRQDYEYYDYIICMEQYDIKNLRPVIGNDPLDKVSLLLDRTERAGQGVADPWYTGDFDSTWIDVVEGCEALLKEIRARLASERM